MFSGIVEELGIIEDISFTQGCVCFKIKARKVLDGIKAGDSISVNGVCLTVTQKKEDLLFFDAIQETLRVSNLGRVKIKEKVNLERSLKVGDRISGHFVLGHVDCLGLIRHKFSRGKSVTFEIAVPTDYLKYCLPKGSIAIDGISLTIAEVKRGLISVNIIPHTLEQTNLASRTAGQVVNLEFDLLAKASLAKMC